MDVDMTRFDCHALVHISNSELFGTQGLVVLKTSLLGLHEPQAHADYSLLQTRKTLYFIFVRWLLTYVYVFALPISPLLIFAGLDDISCISEVYMRWKAVSYESASKR